MLRWFAPRIVVGAAFGACLACSGKTPAPAAADGTENGQGGEGSVVSGAVSCRDDSRVNTYSANLVRPGRLGQLSFTLVSVDPAPPAKGQNTFTVEVSDTGGAPVESDLTVDLTMPDHGHGTSVVPVVTFDAGTQLYTLEPVYLFMAGVWRVQLNVYDDTADPLQPVDSAVFYFCIEG